MRSDILIQLVHSGFLTEDLEAAILAGCSPPMAEIVMALLFASIDAAAVGLAKPEISSRCLLRQGLASSFMLALLFSDSTGAGIGIEASSAVEMAFLA